MVLIKIREPYVAGTFYSADKKMLKTQIESSINHKFGPKKIIEKNFLGAIVPHAGYMYSGPVAAWVYSMIKKSNYIILGPNHYGLGEDFSIMDNGIWKTPLGEILIDSETSKVLKESCELIENDFRAHEFEHSIEVQLPFLQYRFGDDFRFIPISIKHYYPSDELLEKCQKIGDSLAKTIKKSKKNWIVIASSDFSHYLPHAKAKKIDLELIKQIRRFNEKRFFEKIIEFNASACGYCAIAILISAMKKLGCKKSELLSYKTSGDITGDKGSVVGYASIIFY